jgi:hypothetical protein
VASTIADFNKRKEETVKFERAQIENASKERTESFAPRIKEVGTINPDNIMRTQGLYDSLDNLVNNDPDMKKALGNGLRPEVWRAFQSRFGVEYVGEFYGSSYVVDPRGKILAQGPDDGDALVVTDIDLDVAREVKETWQFDEHRRPETYGALTR